MDASYWLITIGSIGLLVGSIALQIRTYSRRRPVRPIWIALGQAAAFGSMVIFSVSLGRPPGVLEWVLILAVGVACGVAYGGLVHVEQTPAGIVMAYTLPWLVVWGALLLVTQGAAAITGRLPWVVYSLAIFTMTLNLGMNGRVIARYRGLRIGGITAVILLAPLLASAFSLAPTSVRPALAAHCAADEVPALLRGLLPPGGLGGTLGLPLEDTLAFREATASDTGLPVVKIDYSSHGLGFGEYFQIEVFRSAADANATWASYIAGLAGNSEGIWMKIGDGGAVRQFLEPSIDNYIMVPTYTYFGISGSAYVSISHEATSYDPASNADDLFLSVLATAGALDPAAVFALAATDSCSGVATATDEPGPDGSTSPGATTPPGGTTWPPDGPTLPPDGTPGQPGGTSGGLSGLEGLLDGAPIEPGQLPGALVLANGLLILGSLSQFLLGSAGSFGGTPSRPDGTPSGPGGSRANGTPFGDGRVWYRAPWDDGGPVPMTPAEVADIESKQRQGLIYSRTDGWVTPQQSSANEAMRAHQLVVERAESDLAAAESHRAIQAARDAQEAARQEIRNINRRAVIDIEMRESERQHAEDMAELASTERAADAWAVAAVAGDLAATGVGIVGGPLGIGVRAGYRVLKGTAGGLGTAIADDASIGETTKRMYIGTVEGAATAGVELAVDGGVRKLFGLPPMFPAAPPPIPPALLAPRAIMRQALGDAAEIAKTKGVDAAARTVDPAKVMRLFQKGGMETLGQLEQAGAVSASEAQVIRKVLTNQVNGCVERGAAEAAWEFEARTGVRLKKVLIGDSGSTAAGKAGSLVFDKDCTYVGVPHPEDLASYAKQNGISPAEAASRLNRELTAAADEKVAEQLGLRGLTPKDVGYTGYSGFGEAAGPADSYAADFTRTRTAVQGRTTVVRPDGTIYRAGREAILDEEGLAARAQGGTMPPVQPTVPFSEFEQLGGQQVKSLVAHTDPKSVAKAMKRVSDLAGRAGIPVDSTVAQAAKEIQADPQRVAEILKSYGLTPDEFRTRALDTSMRFMTKLKDFGQ